MILKINDQDYCWKPGESIVYQETDQRKYQTWNAWKKGVPPTARHKLLQILHKLLQPLTEEVRQEQLQYLREWAGMREGVRNSYRILSDAELERLAKGEMFEIGAHTITHPVLSGLTFAAQESEIRESKLSLEELLGRPVSHFAYPYGRQIDYSAETVRLVREAKFASATTTISGAVRRCSGLYELLRIQIPDCDGTEFERILAGWSGG